MRSGHGERLDDALRADHVQLRLRISAGTRQLHEVEQALLRLEAMRATGTTRNFTGQRRDGAPRSVHSRDCEWCERRLLARIHHLTVATLRKQVEPVTAAQFMRWLLRWQHVAPQSQLAGERGLLEALRQLQGFEIPANAWEKQILARASTDYDPAALDQLCLTGAVGWGRLSPHPATLEDAGEGRRRVVPTSVAPITFFVREDVRLDAAAPRRRASSATKAVAQRIGARCARISAPARRVVLCRHRARNRQAESGD